MALNKKSLVENLDHLMYLISILKENKYPHCDVNLDYDIVYNLEMMVNNFQNISQDISDEFVFEVCEPLDNIIKNLIEQISNALEEDTDSADNVKDLIEDINEIDFLLKDPFLSDDEINELLDRRSDLQEIINNKI
jgi:hypothetical protein